MYSGFNLKLDENATIFGDVNEYKRLQKMGENHLNNQKAIFEEELESYIVDNEIDGTKIQDEWFPQIEADIFISHSGKDDKLANVLAGWIYDNFGLKCFIDSNVWGYSKTLLEKMNSKLSNKRKDTGGGYLYDYHSCNQVSQHVNLMLSIALQKMIDKVEAVVLLNTDNAVRVCSDKQMEKTYSPWIYSEIIYTQFVRKKPLLVYRNYSTDRKDYFGVYESVQFALQSVISYTVSLEHFRLLGECDLIKWKNAYSQNKYNYEYALDALYNFVCPDEVKNTRDLFDNLQESEIYTLQHIYSSQNINGQKLENMQRVWERIIRKGLKGCQGCDRFDDYSMSRHE